MSIDPRIEQGSEMIQMTKQLGKQRDDWRARAEQAEALLRELVTPIDAGETVKSWGYEEAWCLYCKEMAGESDRSDYLDVITHTPDCPIARARALLEAIHE